MYEIASLFGGLFQRLMVGTLAVQVLCDDPRFDTGSEKDHADLKRVLDSFTGMPIV